MDQVNPAVSKLLNDADAQVYRLCEFYFSIPFLADHAQSSQLLA